MIPNSSLLKIYGHIQRIVYDHRTIPKLVVSYTMPHISYQQAAILVQRGAKADCDWLKAVLLGWEDRVASGCNR